MKMHKLIFLLCVIIVCFCSACRNNETKGFSVRTDSPESLTSETDDGLQLDSNRFATSPVNVVLTALPEIRLATIFKVNKDKRRGTYYTGESETHYNDNELGEQPGQNWHHNYMPGMEALYGYNIVNVAHYNLTTNTKKDLFEKPALIKTLYYPAFTKDTLYDKPVLRNFLMTSVYDADTNKDGFINLKDLRRMYSFDINGDGKKQVVPMEYSVTKSKYDPQNDLLFIFAQYDANKNGTIEVVEPHKIFWIDMKDRNRMGIMY